jgi:sulfur carrier protein ThiS
MPVLLDISFETKPESKLQNITLALIVDEQGVAVQDEDAVPDEYWAAFILTEEQD